MLVSFRVKNFKSIVDATLDLRYGEGKAPNGYSEMDRLPFLQQKESAVGKKTRPLRVAPVLAIYGQNAGGKSTLAMALSAFRKVIFSSDSSRGEMLYNPNKLHSDLHYTDFCIEFTTGDTLYKYHIVYNLQGIVQEELYNSEKLQYKIDYNEQIFDFTAIATEDYPSTRIHSIMEVECQNAKRKQVVSLLGKLYKNYSGLNKQVTDACQYLYTKTSVCKDNELSADNALYLLANAYQHENFGAAIDKAFAKVVYLMSNLDIGIQNMKLSNEAIESITQSSNDFFTLDWKDKSKNEHMNLNKIYTYHHTPDGNMVEMRMSDESRGSQVLFSLLAYLLTGLRRGGVVFIDELDRSIHPLVLKSLVSLFTDKTYNKHGAQLIFTAHNTELLDGDELRLSEVGIVTKTAQNGTTLRRLCDFEGVRNVKNFRLGYLDGYFSGIPFPSI